MRCANIFCVYWSDGECSLEEISLDIQGNCEECVYINIDIKELDNRRTQMLKDEFDDC